MQMAETAGLKEHEDMILRPRYAEFLPDGWNFPFQGGQHDVMLFAAHNYFFFLEISS